MNVCSLIGHRPADVPAEDVLALMLKARSPWPDWYAGRTERVPCRRCAQRAYRAALRARRVAAEEKGME